MRALALRPGRKDSLDLVDVPEPDESDGPVLVQSLAVGLCGTDHEIVAAEYGEAPPGSDVLILGHENLGRVLEVGSGGAADGTAVGDLVVGIVRRPDPEPCPACAAGEFDMCRNGRYTEHGIKGLHGFARERWRGQPDEVVAIDPALAEVGILLEPATIVAKAWEQIERIGSRSHFAPRTAAVTGAGPIGLLAALLGVQRGLEVHVYDRMERGRKPDLVGELGAHYHTDTLPHSGVLPDIVVECTGAPSVIVDALSTNASGAVVCLTGVSTSGMQVPIDIGHLNRATVLENDVVFGSVNANRRHYMQAAVAMLAADRDWLRRLITRRIRLDDYASGFARGPEDVKVVIDLAA